MYMNEKLMITISTGILAIGAYLFIQRNLSERWRNLANSTMILSGLLLLYYHNFVYTPSHGIGMLLLPMATIWIAWRQENTGKPVITPAMFILFQILFCFLFVIMVHLQEA